MFRFTLFSLFINVLLLWKRNEGQETPGGFLPPTVTGRSFGCRDLSGQCPAYRWACIRDVYPIMFTYCPRTCGECDWHPWSEYGPCSANCGGGTKTRTRRCKRSRCNNGDSTDSTSCNTQPCAGDSACKDDGFFFSCDQSMCSWVPDLCQKTCGLCSPSTGGTWGPYGPWGTCSVTCGNGEEIRTRTCNGGNCDGSATEKRDCTKPACARWGSFGTFGKCTKSCGGGTQTQTRTCINGKAGGPGCPGSATNSRPCNTKDCARWGNFGSFGKCTKSCGGGTQTQTRTCINGTPGGPGCPGSATNSRQCNTKSCGGSTCTTPSRWSGYGGWSGCSRNCGGGTRTRVGICVKPCGKDCAGTQPTQQEACNTHICGGGGGTGCSKQCGAGVKAVQDRDSTGSFTRYEACNTDRCATAQCSSGKQRMFNDTEERCCTPPPLGQTCGTMNGVGSRVIGGAGARPGEFPWQVFIMPTFCGGVIIHKRMVMTAGHCVHTDAAFTVEADPKKMVVIYGKIVITEAQRNVKNYNVDKFIKHPSYKFPRYDMALLVMKQAFSWTSQVRPACVPSANHVVPDDTSCTVSGFGVSDNKKFALSEPLMHAAVEKFNMNVCRGGYRGSNFYDDIIAAAPAMMCAGSLQGTVDSCVGDSGGGLVCQAPNSCAFTVVGLVSFGPTPCAKSTRPGGYTNVAALHSFWSAEMAKLP